MMRFARTVLMLLLMTGWAAAQCGGHAMGSDEKGKKDSATAGHQAMSCCCCKNMGKDAAKTGAAKAGDKDAAKSEAKSEDGMMAGGMACCAKMGKDGGGMKCGGSDSKAETPEQKMK